MPIDDAPKPTDGDNKAGSLPPFLAARSGPRPRLTSTGAIPVLHDDAREQRPETAGARGDGGIATTDIPARHCGRGGGQSAVA